MARCGFLDKKGKVEAADEIDILVKAKNFDVKRTKLAAGRPENVVHSATLQ